MKSRKLFLESKFRKFQVSYHLSYQLNAYCGSKQTVNSQSTAYIAVAAVLMIIELIMTAILLDTARKAKVATPVATVQIANDFLRPRLVWIIHAPSYTYKFYFFIDSDQISYSLLILDIQQLQTISIVT